MDKTYHDTIVEMESKNVDKEYIQGWIGGYLSNPEREEQRVTDGYTAGYEDGSNKNTDNMSAWNK